MEEDAIFRSGTINPTVEPDYINKKWCVLAQRLNSHGSGPHLTSTEWKKRFSDWKNATRAKYRKIVQHAKGTGGGPKTDIIVTPIEDRGLGGWGKVTVTGTPKVQIVGGLNLPEIENEEAATSSEKFDELENLQDFEDAESSNLVVGTNDIVELQDHKYFEVWEDDEEETGLPLSENVNQAPSTSQAAASTKRTFFDKIKSGKMKKLKGKSAGGKRSLPSISEEFLTLYKENMNNENTNAILEKAKIEIDYNKFKFQVAKYKFENPGFHFKIEGCSFD